MFSSKFISRSKEIMGGVPVFLGTRVPVQTMFDYIEGGDSLDEFLDDFPTVNRKQAIQVLEALKSRLFGEKRARAA